MEVTMPKKFNRSPAATERRKRVIKRLEIQLLTGFKTVSDGQGNISSVRLEDKDIARIKKEIETLKSRT